MKLLIDAGNTLIKWALVNAGDWVSGGALPVAQAGDLVQQFSATQDIRQIWASNVAGAEVAQHLHKTSVKLGSQLHVVIAQEAQCGVRNGYSNPAQLGSDRWAALIAAWHEVSGKCLVVNCGTATTIDTLSEQGEFTGGLILPGIELMQRSLVAGTDQLRPVQAGAYAQFPKNTSDAVFSGAIQASCGAIAAQYALLEDDHAPIVLSGGAAILLDKHINQPLRIMDNLVLQGLNLIAREADKQ